MTTLFICSSHGSQDEDRALLQQNYVNLESDNLSRAQKMLTRSEGKLAEASMHFTN